MIALTAWALWLGALLALFIFVVTLFHNDHDLAALAAPRLFHVFEIYQLILAPVAIVSTLLWRRPLLTMLFLLASVGSVVSPLLITPQINRLHSLGQTHTPQFGKLHGEAMMLYTADTVVIFIAGLFLPRAIKKM
jgi:Domain of unknown function (DUF4149)